MTVQIDFPAEKEKAVMEALKALGVTIKEKKTATAKDRILNSVKKGLEEVELAKQGKVKLQSLDDFLDEL